MKMQQQHSSDLTLLCQMIEPIKIAMLTNVDQHGALTSRPMTPLEMDTEGTLWFFIDRSSVPNAERLHEANLTFSDEGRAVFVSLSGRGELSDDRENMRRLWTSSAAPWFADGAESADLALLKFVPNAAEYWDGPHSKIVRKVAMAASIAAGRPVGIGEHETLTHLSS
jgi:general stress protein 26